jgi:hypothetical protein
MKKTLSLIVSLGLIVGAIYLVFLAPYHIYTLTITEGVNTKFLNMKSSQKELLDGDVIDFSKTKGLDGSEGLFSVYHFSNFILPFPINHPMYSMIPSIKIEQQRLNLGAIFRDTKNREIFSFMTEQVYPFEMTEGEQKIFQLPYFKKYITTKSNAEIWKDLFSKKLSLPVHTEKNFFQSLGELTQIPYSDLVYNLYILYNRHILFPHKISKLHFDQASSIGLVELKSEVADEKLEQIFIINNGFIYSFKMKTKLLSLASVAFRANILINLKLKLSTPDSSVAIYSEYKNITYKNRIDQKGMTYLYLAWSHDLDNQNYLRVIILFLERGKENLKFLQPFYEYAFKKFGTNLSSDKDVILENASEKLKRKIREDLEEESRISAGEKTSKVEENFSTPDEKIKYYLDKAKQNPTKTEENNDVLSIE